MKLVIKTKPCPANCWCLCGKWVVSASGKLHDANSPCRACPTCGGVGYVAVHVPTQSTAVRREEKK